MLRKKHLHALTHKGSADDGKRFYSDGRCVQGAGGYYIYIGRGSGGGRARGCGRSQAGGFFNFDDYREIINRIETFEIL